MFPHLSILDNCTLAPIWVKKMAKKDAEELAMNQSKEEYKFLDQALKFPGQLSGGQQQRASNCKSIMHATKNYAYLMSQHLH